MLNRLRKDVQADGPRGTPGAPGAASPRGSAHSRLGEAWRNLPFRWQILLTISVVALLASVLSGIFAVFDARERAVVETRANIELWTNHIAAKVQSVEKPTELQAFADELHTEMASVRHVSVRILDANGGVVVPAEHHEAHTAEPEARAPSWFVTLVQPDIESRTIEISPRGEVIGSVVISGVPDDEIAEAWELLKLIALLWLAAIALMMVGLYFILGLVLDPLARLGGGMKELEVGHYAFRLDIPNVRELEPIAAAFNELAAALGQANAENSRLYRQLIAVQEEERREISRDLHDEFGPCLFGIMAGTTSLAHHAKTLPPAQAAPIIACVDEIVQVSNHLKSLNRALLNRLRPMALGRRTLSELVSELVATFERRHKGVVFDLVFGDVPATFGEGIDLTIYRCIQEGVTNAIRHGSAQTITVALSAVESSTTPAVEVRVSDDGRGIGEDVSYGYGLSSMRERVQELDGTLKVTPARPHGTVLVVSIPLPDDAVPASD